MNVICCHTDLHPETAAALERFAPECVTIPLDPGDEYAYWQVLAAWWGKGDLLVIEQDIVIGPGTVASMGACEGRSDWCAAPYPVYAGYEGLNERALGCTRFSARLQAEVDPGAFRAPWQTMADRFIALFGPLYPHRHAPVGHLHPAPEGAGHGG